MKSATIRSLLALASAALISAALAGPASAAYGLKEFDATFNEADSSLASKAGSHPASQNTTLAFNTKPGQEGEVPDGSLKDLTVSLPPGFVGDTTVVDPCTSVQFVQEKCPASSQVGKTDLIVTGPNSFFPNEPVYAITPPPGEVMKLGFHTVQVPVTIDLKVNPAPPYNVIATLQYTPNAVPLYKSVLTIFGTPPGATKPFLTLPRACEGPLAMTYSSDSWEETAVAPVTGAAATVFEATDCASLGFGPTIAAKPTDPAAGSSSGIDFDLNIDDPGLTTIGARADSDIEKALVTLPEGMTTNSSVANGLAVCSLADYGRESLDSAPGEGCPEASKVGTVSVSTPLVADTLGGEIFVAKQNENPFNSLLALYVVIKSQKLGIIVKQPVKVEPDPATGRLTTTVDAIPQLPFSNFHLHFRNGPRAPLITPATCATYSADAELYPYANPGAPVHAQASFAISSGANGSPCPATPAQQPHSPSFSAGTISPTAGAYSPFVFKLAREDGSQLLSSITAIPPAGLLGRLAGIPYCSEAQIASATSRSGQGQGALEQSSPSCPAASQVGSATVGAGAGSMPYYVSAKAYLAGPYKGAPFSMVIITPAIAGPFDLGVVAVRTAFYVDRETTKVKAVSDPLPTILFGLPLDVRSIVLNLDRPNFTLNPTNCEPLATTGSLTSTLGTVSPLNARFQASSCDALGFKPKLSLRLKGGTKRNINPALSAKLTYPKGAYANIAYSQVTLPHSEFLDQSHIRTVCTRVQFAADQCPAGSIYGKAEATTPLLDAPLKGNVYLRSSSNPLPDMVVSLEGQIDVALVGRVDTSPKAGIRTTFDVVPDAPVSTFTLNLNGGKRGLLVNSRDICNSPQKASVRFIAQNGRVLQSRPTIANDCKSKGKGNNHKGKGNKAKRSGGGDR